MIKPYQYGLIDFLYQVVSTVLLRILSITRDIFFISAATGEGTKELIQSLEEVISKNKLDLA